MNTFMAVMSQLFWGVTVGALSSAFLLLAKGAAVIACAGCGLWWHVRRGRARRDD